MGIYEKEKAMYDGIFSKHTLEMVLHKDPFRAYMLKAPGEGRLNGVMIMFTPEGIVIAGDHAPGRHGLVSCVGYGLDWFSSPKGAEYLCEKFGVEKIWLPELAVKYLQDSIREMEEREDVSVDILEEWGQLLELVEFYNGGAHEFYSTLNDLNVDGYYELAQGYDPNIISKLAAIQHRFAALMGELDKECAKQEEKQGS